jgi:hypothetical protein
MVSKVKPSQAADSVSVKSSVKIDRKLIGTSTRVTTESVVGLTHQKHTDSTPLFKKSRNKGSKRETTGDYAQMGEVCQSEVSSTRSQNSRKPGD